LRVLGSRSSCYTSVYSYERVDSMGKIDYTSVVIDRAWWDFDSGELGTIEEVKSDVAVLLSRLDGDVRLVATGRGFHIHQLFDKPVKGKHWVNKLQSYEKSMARGLKTLDGVANAEKLTRIPGTFNARRGRWAVPIPTNSFLLDPHSYNIPKKPYEGMEEYDPYITKVVGGFDFAGWSETNPYVEEVQAPQVFIGEVSNAGEVPLTPCLERAIAVDNPSHHVRVALVQHMADQLRDFAHPDTIGREEKKAIEESIYEFISGLGWRDFKPHLTRQGIRTNVKYENTPTCKWYISKNMCAGKCWRYDGTTNVGW